MKTPYDYAKEELGVREIPGPKHNQRVLEYHKTTGAFSTDEVPWCSSFVNWCFKKAGKDSIRSKSASARSWARLGSRTTRPQEGDLVVFGKPKSYKGHVGFFVKKKFGWIKVLGGNQKNQVCYQWYWRGNPKLRLLSYRSFK